MGTFASYGSFSARVGEIAVFQHVFPVRPFLLMHRFPLDVWVFLFAFIVVAIVLYVGHVGCIKNDIVLEIENRFSSFILDSLSHCLPSLFLFL